MRFAAKITKNVTRGTHKTPKATQNRVVLKFIAHKRLALCSIPTTSFVVCIFPAGILSQT